jgi:FimV-like protein
MPFSFSVRVLTIGLLVLLLVRPASGQTVPAPPPDSTLASIDSLRAQGQFREALTYLDRLAPDSTHDVAILWRRALMWSDCARAHRKTAPTDSTVARHRRALEWGRAALAADSTNAWAHLVVALTAGRLTLHVKRGTRIRYSRLVKQHTDRAIALDSTLAPAYHLRGRWHREVADINFIKKALAKAIYGGLPPASLDQSIHDFTQAIALESKPYNHLELAKTYLEVGRDSSARAHLNRVFQTSGSPFADEHRREARALLDRLE